MHILIVYGVSGKSGFEWNEIGSPEISLEEEQWKSSIRAIPKIPVLSSWMLISPQNSSTKHISVQISEVPVGSEQPSHNHEPEQCYYIIKGKGLMIIEEETREVTAGDAVYIPSNSKHGIKNIGKDILEYLTANLPTFSEHNENALWPEGPVRET